MTRRPAQKESSADTHKAKAGTAASVYGTFTDMKQRTANDKNEGTKLSNRLIGKKVLSDEDDDSCISKADTDVDALQKDEEETTNDSKEPTRQSEPKCFLHCHPESPGTRLWRKIFFHFFDGKSISKQLKAGDVWALTEEHTSAVASKAFMEVYRQHANGSLMRVIWRVHCKRLAICWLFQLLSMLCDSSLPVLLYILLYQLIAEGYKADQVFGLLAAIYFVGLLQVLLYCHGHFQGFKINLKIVGALRTVLFENTIKRTHHFPIQQQQPSQQKRPLQQERKRMAEIANMYNRHVLAVGQMVSHIHIFWRSMLQIVFEVYFLVQVIEISSRVMLIAWLCFGGMIFLISVLDKRYKKKWHLKVEERLNIIHECFKGIQMVKLNAWEDRMQEKIEQVRAAERQEQWKVELLMVARFCLSMDSPNILSIFIFGWMAMQDDGFSPASVFTALLLFRRIKDHFYGIVGLSSIILKGKIALKRIDTYLHECQASGTNTVVKRERCKHHEANVVIAVERACFSHGVDTSKAILLNVSFEVRRSELVLVQGKAGAGKSTLLGALLGDVNRLYGDMFVANDSKVAYCSQEPWLQTLSIKENILFGSEYDERKYLCILEACCLVDDLRMLPDGDQTKVGPKGVNLSGGQKGRIALARACYADADIYLLDCPFASVDAVVQSDVFTKCIVELLRSKTVIMVTHNPEILSSPFVDQVLTVEELTVHAELTHSENHSRRLIDGRSQLPPWKHVDTFMNDDRCTDKNLNLWTPSKYSQTFAVGKNMTSALENKTSSKDEAWFSRDTLKVFFLHRCSVKLLACSLVSLVLYAVAAGAKDVWLMSWSATAATSKTPDEMIHSAYVYGYIVIGSLITGFASGLLHAKSISVVSNRLFHDMTYALLRAPMTFFYSTPIGEIFNRFFNDISVLDVMMSHPFLSLFRSAVLLCASDVIVWYYTGIAGTGILLVIVFVSKELFHLGFFVRIMQLSFQSETANLNFISEALDGSSTIRAFGSSQIDRFCLEHGKISDELIKGKYLVETFNNFVLIRSGRIHVVHMALLALLLSMHNIPPAELGLLLYYIFTIHSDILTLSARLLSAILCLLNVERVRQFSMIEPESEMQALKPIEAPPKWPQRGNVVFDRVWFRYSHDPEFAMALRDVSFSVSGGEKIGIVGRTGSGKSSLGFALFRVHALARGRILVDGVDVSLLSLSDLRSKICLIPQSPMFYRCSLRNYLDPFEQFDEEKLWNVIHKCVLTESVTTLDDELGDNGENWSVGERQKLCLARALLKPSRILILDESFSSVDQACAQKLLEILETDFRESTVFLVTHRLDEVLKFDRIMVMQDGQLAEFGAAEELAADPGSMFYEFLETTLLTY